MLKTLESTCGITQPVSLPLCLNGCRWSHGHSLLCCLRNWRFSSYSVNQRQTRTFSNWLLGSSSDEATTPSSYKDVHIHLPLDFPPWLHLSPGRNEITTESGWNPCCTHHGCRDPAQFASLSLVYPTWNTGTLSLQYYAKI